ncbi:hypothetical protein [Cytobacillus gottheilii]|uniref:hypothetical protein n=1 Tax=Cytobacillus gottheilii TaxID=859144 RepID=UPI0009BA0FD4|nr:hypothetical protein [Cytobacillus gottheilii]
MDEPFNELDKVYRSNVQKQQTRQLVFQAIENRRIKRRHIVPNFLTVIFAISACFLFSYIMIFANDFMENKYGVGSLKAEGIEYIVVSPSMSDAAFAAIEYSYTVGQSIIQDQTYSIIVTDMVNHAKETDYRPETAAKFDIMLVFPENKQLKIKLWEEKEQYYMKTLGNEQLYRLEEHEARKFVNMMELIVQS